MHQPARAHPTWQDTSHDVTPALRRSQPDTQAIPVTCKPAVCLRCKFGFVDCCIFACDFLIHFFQTTVLSGILGISKEIGKDCETQRSAPHIVEATGHAKSKGGNTKHQNHIGHLTRNIAPVHAVPMVRLKEGSLTAGGGGYQYSEALLTGYLEMQIRSRPNPKSQ